MAKENMLVALNIESFIQFKSSLESSNYKLAMHISTYRVHEKSLYYDYNVLKEHLLQIIITPGINLV